MTYTSLNKGGQERKGILWLHKWVGWKLLRALTQLRHKSSEPCILPTKFPSLAMWSVLLSWGRGHVCALEIAQARWRQVQPPRASRSIWGRDESRPVYKQGVAPARPCGFTSAAQGGSKEAAPTSRLSRPSLISPSNLLDSCPESRKLDSRL